MHAIGGKSTRASTAFRVRHVSQQVYRQRLQRDGHYRRDCHVYLRANPQSLYEVEVLTPLGVHVVTEVIAGSACTGSSPAWQIARASRTRT